MMARTWLATALAGLWLAAAPASAAEEQRPSEDSLFGSPAPETSPSKTERVPQDSQRPSEDAIFGGPSAAPQPSSLPSTETSGPGGSEAAANPDPTRIPDSRAVPGATDGDFVPQPTFGGEETAPEDPLKIGGLFYMRSTAVAQDETAPSRWSFSSPTLVDGYFDARPNERVRGFLLARLSFDPTIASSSSTASTPTNGLPFAPSGQSQINIALDQLWLRFDIERTVFVTAGRQHVKWGPARFWNPTDFLHQVRRDPLAVFDARLGTTMLRLHVPWEKQGWNFYAVGLVEDAQPASQLGRLGAAARAEAVVGTAEFGASAIVHKERAPKVGLDLSAGVGPIDVYGEVALSKASETARYRFVAPEQPLMGVERDDKSGTGVGATGGVNWSFKYNDDDVFTLGGEYFYNSLGYDEARLYPWLMAQGAFNFFYVGQHYAGLYGVLMAPGSWNNTSFVLSHLANLSDNSHVTRLDYSVLVLTHLRLEAYGAGHFGEKEGGEFFFGLDLPPAPQVGLPNGLRVRPPRFEAGVGLRIAI